MVSIVELCNNNTIKYKSVDIIFIMKCIIDNKIDTNICIGISLN
jgi:hypothetical protein